MAEITVNLKINVTRDTPVSYVERLLSDCLEQDDKIVYFNCSAKENLDEEILDEEYIY